MYSLPIDAKGLAVTPDALADLTVQTSTPENGGTFPAGVNDLWHGGVHIAPVSGLPFHAAMPGTIVAARLGAEELDRYGSPNFLLLRHTWPPFAEDEGTPFYSAYVHLAPPAQTPASLKAIGRSADEAPWFTTVPQLRVTVPTLNVRGAPSPTAEIETQVSRGTQLPILDGPTDRNGFRWWTVDAPGIPYETYAAERRLDGDGQYAERVAPAIDADTLGTLQAGDVVALDRPVAAGTQLWWSGEFGFPPSEIVSGIPLGELFKRAPTLHWEVFSGAPVLGHEDGTGDGREVGAWKALEDQNDDYVLNPDEAGSLHDTMEQIWSESDATETIEADSFGDASPDDRLPFFIEEERLRRTAAKFRSEWDIQNEAMAMEGLQWWGEAVSAGVELPDSSKTWHYHPVGALEAIRPRFTVEGANTTLDGPVETMDDVAEKVIEAFGYSGDLSSLSESEFERVRSEIDFDRDSNTNLQVKVSNPAPEEAEEFAHVHFEQSKYGHVSLDGSNYFLGIFATSTGQNDPDLYEMLEGNNPTDGVPGRTPPASGDGGPENENRWSGEEAWFGDFEQDVWASITESEGSLQALNTYDTAFLSVGPVQQTAGRGEAKGELQGALSTLQANAPEVYWRHFGRFGLRPVDASLVDGAKKAHFELRGEKLDSGEKKEELRSFKWAHLFQRAMQNPTVRYWMMREGFERLRRIQNRAFMIQVPADNQEEPHEFDATIADIFSRDLSQALLLDTHVNQPGDIWSDDRGASIWLRTTEEKFQEWNITSADDLPLTEARELDLVAMLLQARIGEMSSPGKRAGWILGYTEIDLVEEIAKQSGFRREGMRQEGFIASSLREHINENAKHAWISTDLSEILTFNQE
jgi:hypothetical protein